MNRRYLQKRGAIWYFRIPVPKHLWGHLNRKELTISLHTSCDNTARLKRNFLESEVIMQLFNIQIAQSTNPDEMEHWLKEFFKSQLIRFDEIQKMLSGSHTDGVPHTYQRIKADQEGWFFGDVVDTIDGASPSIDESNDTRMYGAGDYFYLTSSNGTEIKFSTKCPTREYIHRNNQSLQKHYSSEEYREFCFKAHQIYQYLAERYHKHLTGDGSETKPIIFEDVIREFKSSQSTRKSNNQISVLYKKYIDDGEHSASTTKQKDSQINRFIEFTNDCDISDVDEFLIRDYRDLLKRIPKSAKSYKQFRGMSLSQIVNSNNGRLDVISKKTLNGYMVNLNGFFRWCIKNKYYPSKHNPVTDLIPEVKKTKKRVRRGFNEGELEAVFHTPIYMGRKTVGKNLSSSSGDIFTKDFWYWLLLIAYYTGARLSEISDLPKKGVKQIDNVWCFDIYNTDHRSLKTEDSERVYPIHSDLFTLGFGEIIKQCKKNSDKLFFDSMIGPSSVSDGRISPNASKRMNRYLTRVGIKTGRDLVFHSMRHTNENYMRESIDDLHMRCYLSGREVRHSSAGYGSDPWTGMVKKKKELIETKMSFPATQHLVEAAKQDRRPSS